MREINVFLNEEKIEKDLYEGMSLAASMYWSTIFNVAEKYIDETDDDGDTFMNEITTMTVVMFAKTLNNEYDKMIKSKEES